jgi:DNA-binding NarL/FixJ family response regulator
MKHALLIDDLPDALDRLAQAAHLAFPHIECQRAGSVADSLRALAQPGLHLDLALVDLDLGDGSGLTVIEALSRLHPDCLIVVVTIYDDDAHLFPALEAGAQGYLLKDQPLEQLVQQLRGIGEGQPPLSPAIARRLIRHFTRPEVGATGPTPVSLSPRETEVLALLAQGIRLGELAERLGISRHTAGDHVKNIYRKLNISSRAEAALQAARLGLVG